MSRFEGAFTALVTPFGVNGRIDEAAFRRLVRWQIDEGIDGLVICGTTGESATLSAQEKLHLFQVAMDEARGQVPIVAGTGSNNTASSVELTHAAAELGVDGVLAVAPYYNKPNQEGLFAHFSAIAQVGVPVMLYNVPGRTVISMTAQTVARLAELPNVVSIKEASADLSLDSEMMALTSDKPDFTYLSGDDFTTLPFLALGGHGCVSVVSNVAPALVHALWDKARRGELEEARALHHQVHRLAKLCFCDSNPAPTKWMLSLMDHCRPDVRMPMLVPAPEIQERLREGLRQEGLL